MEEAERGQELLELTRIPTTTTPYAILRSQDRLAHDHSRPNAASGCSLLYWFA